MIPTFGIGWEIDSTDLDLFAPRFNGHVPIWLDNSDECGARVKKHISSLCTFTDSHGNLQLCNLNCEECPCTDSMKTGDKLPSGWYWNFEPEGCAMYDSCLVGRSWGIWGPNAFGYLFFDQEILLKVKEFASIDNCIESNDLQIGFQELFDDFTGCWQHESDEIRDKYTTQKWEIDCNAEPIMHSP